jgi:hypothetical protein
LNENAGACSIGVGVGALAFITLVFFLIVDARFDSLSSIKIRRRAVVSDLAISGLISIIVSIWSFKLNSIY